MNGETMNDETEASYAVHERLRNAWLAGCRAGLDAAAKRLNDENCPNCAVVIWAMDPKTVESGAAPVPDTAQDSDGASESPHESPTIDAEAPSRPETPQDGPQSDGASESPHESPTIDAEAPALDQPCTEAAPEPAPMSQRGE